jgi:glycosyltransferase involved in cell wall biosynthesis
MVRLLSKLSSEKFDITVVSIADTSQDIVPLLPDHVSLCDLNIGGSSPSLRNFSRLLCIAKKSDLVVCSLFHATLVGVILASIFSIPTTLVWQHNSEYKNNLRRWLFSKFYSQADRVLADSKAVKEMLVHSEGVKKNKISVLPISGVDLDRFQPESVVPSGDHYRIGTIGRLIDRKGYPDLFETAERLGDRFQFYIIGEGSELERYERLAPENVHLLGAVDDDILSDRLASFDIYFQPSHFEGLCMTVIEAMACGLPVVASSVGGITESVVDGETGLLCEPRDIKCFCDSLSYFAEHPDEATEMGLTGRERVKNRYSADALATAFERVVSETYGAK